MQLVWPSLEHLPSYVAALERGWSADNVRGEVAAREELAKINDDAPAFIASLVNREGKGAPVTLPDGSLVARIPGFRRWLWDGEFCGSIAFRWQPGTTALPPHCLGHIGYAVVPWKQGRGYATLALRFLLPEAKAEGLPFVEITTDPENLASQRVIQANGGVLVERFTKPPQFGSVPGLRFRVALERGRRPRPNVTIMSRRNEVTPMDKLLKTAATFASTLFLFSCIAARAADAPESSSDKSPGVVEKVERAVKHGANAAAHGVKRAASATARGVKRAASATARGVEHGAKATEHAVGHVAGTKDKPAASSPAGTDK